MNHRLFLFVATTLLQPITVLLVSYTCLALNSPLLHLQNTITLNSKILAAFSLAPPFLKLCYVSPLTLHVPILPPGRWQIWCRSAPLLTWLGRRGLLARCLWPCLPLLCILVCEWIQKKKKVHKRREVFYLSTQKGKTSRPKLLDLMVSKRLASVMERSSM